MEEFKWSRSSTPPHKQTNNHADVSQGLFPYLLTSIFTFYSYQYDRHRSPSSLRGARLRLLLVSVFNKEFTMIYVISDEQLDKLINDMNLPEDLGEMLEPFAVGNVK